MPATLTNAFDVAFYFTDVAVAEGEYLQPQKLQGLMFLAQAYYAVAFKGQKLMPAIFVADERGPLEPNIYVGFSRGRPDIDVDLFLSKEVENFLDAVWRRFGHFSSGKIVAMTKGTNAYKRAFKRGNRAEIYLSDMKDSFIRADTTPGVETVVKPEIYRTQAGKPVTVKTWVPGSNSND